jgi:hypothetical protein
MFLVYIDPTVLARLCPSTQAIGNLIKASTEARSVGTNKAVEIFNHGR